jgi:3-oxoadipate enol-lactonase
VVRLLRSLGDLMTPFFSVVSLPFAQEVDLGERGSTHACDLPGPGEDAKTVLLLHGLGATAMLNWQPAFEALSARFRVVALDLRGHGRSPPLDGRFRLADCADDVAAAAEALDVDRAIVVGYSMGSQVAQLVWHRHPDLVEGLVLCAATRNFQGSPGERLFFTALPVVMGALQLVLPSPPPARSWADEPVDGEAPALSLGGSSGASMRRLSSWAWEEFRSVRPRAMLDALSAIGRFSSHEWVGRIDVPTAVVVTMRDRGVPPMRQIKLAHAIPGASIHAVDAGHTACMFGSQRFVPVLVEACESVLARVTGSQGMPNGRG